MSPLKGWQVYQRDVGQVASDIMTSLTGDHRDLRVSEDVRVIGGNGRENRIDVLVRAGSDALFIECKDHSRRLNKGVVAAVVNNFQNVASGAPELRWRLAIVAPLDIPVAARAPAIQPSTIPIVNNMAGGSLSRSSHFVYFAPPRDPLTPVPLFVLDEHDPRIGQTAAMGSPTAEASWGILHDARLPLAARVTAGLSLLARDPELMARNDGASRALVHGLMHLGRIQEAMYVRRLIPARGSRDVAIQIEQHMIRFQLLRQRYPHLSQTGKKEIQALDRMVGAVPLRDDASIRTFAGPIIAMWGDRDRGLDLLAGVEPRAEALDAEDAPYFQLLQFVREAQLASSEAEKGDLLFNARAVLDRLPAWNRFLGEALIEATEVRPAFLHGLLVPFDVEEWSAQLPSR